MDKMKLAAVRPLESLIDRPTILMQAAAAILIANSHLEPLYPRPWMAADGFIGNSIFFLLSGYGITLSLRSKQQSFVQYYLRRILRIYPALWLVELIFHLGFGGVWRTATVTDLVRILVYPTNYGYVRQVMIFYILFFCLRPWLRGRILLSLFGGLWLPLLTLCGFDLWRHPETQLHLGDKNDWMWEIFFFQVMLFGGYLAASANRVPGTVWSGVLRLVTLLVLYVGLKFLMVLGMPVPGVGCSFAEFYILLFALVPLIVWQFFVLATSEVWVHWLRRHCTLQLIGALVGGMTLEIYIVHGFVYRNQHIQKILFPLNVGIFFVVTLVLAACIHWSARRLNGALVGRFLNSTGVVKVESEAKR